MADTLLIVSPSAGRGRPLRLSGPVFRALGGQRLRPVMHITESLADATHAAATAASDCLVVSLGGDGLHGAVAAGVNRSGATLLPLAGGRGNDTVRRLGLPADPLVSITSLDRLRVTRLDLGIAAGVPFLSVANAGFDAQAAELANSSKVRLGSLTYLYSGARALFGWRRPQFTVTVDGDQERFRGWFVAVGNIGQYGGGIRIAPNAEPDDGKLDVVTLGAVGRMRAAATFVAALAGRHGSYRGVTERRGSTVTIAADQPLTLYADGEPVAPLPVTIELLRAAVRVAVPASLNTGMPARMQFGEVPERLASVSPVVPD